MKIRTHAFISALLRASLLLCAIGFASSALRAADHRDGPRISVQSAPDIADVFFFLDPNDNSRAILSMTTSGFIVPSEAVNQAIFDPTVHYQFRIEGTGDAAADALINVSFSPRTSTSEAQNATVRMSKGANTVFEFVAPATNPSLNAAAPAQVVTTDDESGVKFFAGEVDDPFFFDLTAFSRFVTSVLGGSPDPTLFNRHRDSFAGYNTMAISLSIPQSHLPRAKNVVGVSAATFRQGEQIDRMGIPAVNVALVPFARKDEYNASNPKEDAAGRFAEDIVGTLKALGTDDTSIGILANVAVTHGDILRLNLNLENSGPGGGNNGGAAFPNGRRLGDDTIDTLLTLINNRNPLGDNVNANDVPLQNTFPFFAKAQQPRNMGVDDNTRN